MAFINEIVSDADIDAYGLPFEKGKGHWWTRDKERDLYLWGGRGGNPARGEEIQGRFNFYINQELFRLGVSLGEWSPNWHENPYRVAWGDVLWIDPPIPISIDRECFFSMFKEALVAYGSDGALNKNIAKLTVSFGF